jgi:hypothetical protein
MEFSERQLELARSLAIKERMKEIEAYRKLGLSYLCPYCRTFLDTDDYSEFARARANSFFL